MTTTNDEALFAVSLDGIRLTEDQIRNIDKGIREVVFREIAMIDHGGDLVFNRKLQVNPRFSEIKIPIVWGIWIERLDIFQKRK